MDGGCGTLGDLEEQGKLINEWEWNFLIVLDTCRYDYFEKVFEDYFSGELRKVVSSGSVTGEWYKNTFTEVWEDTVYVSANPNINSYPDYGLDSEKRFAEVIDVWDWGWDENKSTVYPSEVNKGVDKARRKFPDHRYIVHYMQPHGPYLSLDLSYRRDKQPVTEKISSKPSFSSRIRNFIGRSIRDILGARVAWKISDFFFGFQRSEPIGRAVMDVGVDGLKEAYEENLRIALKEISFLLQDISSDRKVVITSDHGELLGEDGEFGHIKNRREDPLIEVPWLEVEDLTCRQSTFPEKARITRKIRNLEKESKI